MANLLSSMMNRSQQPAPSVKSSAPQNPLAMMSQIKQILSGKDINQVAQNMMKVNPQFAEFVKANQGKTPDQIAQTYGIDMSMVRSLID